MLIKNVDKEQKKSKLKTILPIASSGLALGLTAYLMQQGVIQYDDVLNLGNGNLDKITQICQNLPFLRNFDPNTIAKTISGDASKVGITAYALYPKIVSLGTSIVKPIIESDKVQNSKLFKKIKKVNKDLENDPNLIYKPKIAGIDSRPHPIRKGLELGASAFLIANNILNFNNVYDFSNLPHKFANIAEIASKIDFNKLVLGSKGVGVIREIIGKVKEKRNNRENIAEFAEEKDENIENIDGIEKEHEESIKKTDIKDQESKEKDSKQLKSKITFKGLVKKIFNEKDLPSLFSLSETEKQFLTRTKVEMIDSKHNVQATER